MRLVVLLAALRTNARRLHLGPSPVHVIAAQRRMESREASRTPGIVLCLVEARQQLLQNLARQGACSHRTVDAELPQHGRSQERSSMEWTLHWQVASDQGRWKAVPRQEPRMS